MTDSTQRFVPGKLAFRIEHTRTAHRWVAYFVPAPALDADLDDVELGSIAIPPSPMTRQPKPRS